MTITDTPVQVHQTTARARLNSSPAVNDRTVDDSNHFSFLPQVGDEVAILRFGGRSHTVTFDVVDRIGKRDLVLRNGGRFNVGQGGRTDTVGYGFRDENGARRPRFPYNGYSILIPVTHPRIPALKVEHQRAQITAGLVGAVRDVHESARWNSYFGGWSEPKREQVLALVTAAERWLHVNPEPEEG